MGKVKAFRRYFLSLKFIESLIVSCSLLIVFIILCVFTNIPGYFALFGFLIPLIFFIRTLINSGDFKIARYIEKNIPELDEKIITYLQFRASKNVREKQIAHRLEKTFEKYNFKKTYPLSMVVRKFRILVYSLTYFFLFMSLFPGRFAEYHVGVGSPPLYLKTEPHEGVFFVPGTIHIKTIPYGQKVEKVFIEYQIGQNKNRDLMKKLDGFFTYSVNAFKPAILTYNVRAKGFRGKEHRIVLKEKPFLKLWTVYVQMPDGKKDTLYLTDRVNFVEGASVKIGFEFGGDFDSGYVFMNNSLIKKFYDRNTELDFKDKSGIIKFVYFTENIKIEDLQKIELIKGRDLPPFIYVVFPPFDQEINEDMKVPFVLYVMDDLSLKYIDLNYRFKTKDLKRIKNYKAQREDTVFYNLDLSHLPLLPGDTVEVWFEVADRGLKGKSQVSKSRTYRFWVPTYTEIYQETSGEMEEQISFLKGEGREVGEFLKDLKSFQEKISQLKEKKEFEDIREMVQNLERNLEQMSQRFEEYSKKVQNLLKRQPLDAELQEKLFKLRELFKEIMTPEFEKIFEDLKKALKSMNPEKLKEAYKNLMLNQELLKEQIERTLELLEKVKQEVKLKEFIQRMKEMEEKMEGMEKNLQDLSIKDFEDLKGEMQRLSEEMKDLSKSFKGEEKRVGEQLKEGEEKLEHSLSEMNLSMNMQLQNKMSECRGKMSSSKKSLQQARQKTEEALENLLSMRNKLRAEELENMFFSAIFLSEKQSEISEQIKKKEEDIVGVEKEIINNRESLRRFKEDILKVARKNLTFPRSILNYAFSAYFKGEELYEKSRILEFDKMEKLSEEIKDYLTLLALEILRLKGEGQGGGASQALMQALKKLSRLAREQSHINALTQSLLPLGTGEAPSEEFLKSVQRIAGMQKSLAEKLKEILETIKEAGGTEGLENQIEKALEEMQKVAEEIEKGEIKREVLERQERILSRMLEAQRSIYKREFTKKRYAEEPKPYQPLPSPQKVIEEDEIIRRSIIKVLNSNMSYEDKKTFIDYLNSLLK